MANRYEILEKVGDGGMALVYSAKDHLLSRTVAVKILRSQFADDDEFVERFRREARSAAGLSHPNIVNIYDVGEIDRIHYIVMEFVQGNNLHDLIRDHGQHFSQEVIVSVGKQIAMGLAHAHYHGIIHRDIKPHNILVTDEGRVKVTDFGIAQAMSSTNLTQTGMVLGSVHYFSPEQARGVNVQAASDLYSLGIVLYEMIAGHPPFKGDSPISIALKHIQDNPLPLRDVRPDLDSELEDLVLKLLNKDPKKRAGNAEEVVRAFQRIERRLEMAQHGEGQEPGDQTMPLPVAGQSTEGGLDLAGRKKRSKKKGKKTEGARRSSKGLIILVILLILGGAGFGLVRLIPKFLFPEDVKVPDVVGLFELEAARVLREADLILKVEQAIFDNEVPAGYIISQDPLAGRMVKQNREILVRVSKGPEEVVMPSVVGLTAREGKLALTQAGFVLGDEEEAYDPEVSPGVVIEQWPEPGEVVMKGTVVDLVVSKGQEAPLSFALPDFRGQDFETVKARIRELGLPLGNSWPEYSTIYPQGQVIEQNPAPGTQVQPGWSIDFVYSQGTTPAPHSTQVPEDPREEPQWIHENLWKTENVTINVPPGPEQEVVILVIDDFGAREVYRQVHRGGSSVEQSVQGRGQNARLQVYIGGRQFYDALFQE